MVSVRRLLVLVLVLLQALPAVLLVESRDKGPGTSAADCGCGGDNAAANGLMAHAEKHIAKANSACAVACLERAVHLALLSWRPLRQGRDKALLEAHDNALSDTLLPMQRLAKVLYGVRDVGRAAAVLQLATRLVPASGEACRGLGQLQRELGKPRAAFAAFLRALALQPGNPAFMFSLASLLQQPPTNAQHVQPAGDDGALHTAQPHQQHAEQLYRRALQIQPTYGDASNNLGNLLRARGNVEEAVQFFEMAVRGVPTNHNYLLNLGSSQVSLERYLDAALSFRTATQLQPHSATMYRALGASYDKSTDHASALAAFTHALRLSPSHPASYLGAATAHRNSGNLKAAIKILTSCPRVHDSQTQAGIYAQLAAMLLDRADAALVASASPHITLLHPLHIHNHPAPSSSPHRLDSPGKSAGWEGKGGKGKGTGKGGGGGQEQRKKARRSMVRYVDSAIGFVEEAVQLTRHTTSASVLASSLDDLVSLALSHSVSLALSHSVSLALSHSVSLALSHSVSLALSHSVSLALSHVVSLALSHVVSLALSHFLSRSLAHVLSLSIALSRARAPSLTHIPLSLARARSFSFFSSLSHSSLLLFFPSLQQTLGPYLSLSVPIYLSCMSALACSLLLSLALACSLLLFLALSGSF